jgi:type III restriction enzyme
LVTSMAYEIGAVCNNLLNSHDVILTNLQSVQDRNGFDLASGLANDELDFDVEMGIGTGNMYVQPRTIFEFARKYNFAKFIIMVPSELTTFR